MAANYAVEDLQEWNQRIVDLVQRFGLDPYTQEFGNSDYEAMRCYIVYSGMPSHYPHWSYGKDYEKLKTLYDYGLSGLPYEMVINSDPCIAYLMRDNTLALQILTIAHVYGHNDFFKNNFTFRTIRAEFTIETFKAHANRVRHYVEDPSIGLEKVERVLDAAHALSLQCRRNLSIRKPTEVEQRETKFREDIEKRWSQPDPEEEREYGPKKKNAKEKLFEVREVERDSSFLRRYLTEGLVRELNLFEYKSRGNEKVISRVADEDSWQGI